MSGGDSSSKCSWHHIFPVGPPPVCTSSISKATPCYKNFLFPLTRHHKYDPIIDLFKNEFPQVFIFNTFFKVDLFWMKIAENLLNYIYQIVFVKVVPTIDAWINAWKQCVKNMHTFWLQWRWKYYFCSIYQSIGSISLLINVSLMNILTFFVICRSFWKNWGDAWLSPPSAWIGSTTTPATGFFLPLLEFTIRSST